jgi:peptidoglycan biosynthesis protein MviN/MurJ (putative lipid II flippase)
VKLLQTIKTYPFSIGGFVISFLPWSVVSIGMISIKLNPVPTGHRDYRGEGLAVGVLLALLLAAVFILITLANLRYQKEKKFYAKLVITTAVIHSLCYGLGILI